MISDKPNATLPHREPFLWVTRLMARSESGTEGVVEYDVREDLDIFRGHFPGKPIFPGVLQIEAAAQSCLWVYEGELVPDAAKLSVLFVSVDSFKFKKPVIPPSTLRFSVKQVQKRGALQKWEANVHVADTLVSAGVLWVYSSRDEVQPTR